MTGHGNDYESNQQPVHQDNSLPECLPELIPEELCCPHPLTYSINHDLAKNACENFMVAQPCTGDQQVDGVAGSATNTPYQYIYICRDAGELSGGIPDHANEGTC